MKSQRIVELSSEKAQNIINESCADPSGINNTSVPYCARVETMSTADSIHESHFLDGTSTLEPAEANWCVSLPSEAVLFFDNLRDLFAE